MLRENILDIINTLNDLDKRDVFKESVENRLNQSLLLYYDNLNMTCNKLLEEDCSKVIRKIVEYKKRELDDGN